MSIGCGFGQLDRFAFDDYSAHLHPYDVEQKDNWTMLVIFSSKFLMDGY